MDTVSRFPSRVKKHANRCIQTSFKDSTYYSQFLESSTPSKAQGKRVFQTRDQVGTNLPNTSQAKLVGQLHRALQGLNYASSELQKRGFCCDRYTILTMSSESQKSPSRIPVIRMNTVTFRDVNAFANDISALAQRGINELSLSKSFFLAGIGILEALFDIQMSYLLSTTPEQKLHICALTVQVLSLGLSFYSQGHTGE